MLRLEVELALPNPDRFLLSSPVSVWIFGMISFFSSPDGILPRSPCVDCLFEPFPVSEPSLATTLGCEVGPPLIVTSSLSDLLLIFPASLKIPPRTSNLDVSKNAKSSKLGATRTSAIYYRLVLELKKPKDTLTACFKNFLS